LDHGQYRQTGISHAHRVCAGWRKRPDTDAWHDANLWYHPNGYSNVTAEYAHPDADFDLKWGKL
jgi:hypothetical protein